MWRAGFGLILLIGLATAGVSSAAQPIGLQVSWAGPQRCFDPQSPPFRVSSVPAGTRVLRFHMTDLDAPNFVHGGGDVAWTGQAEIPRGAFTYRGPCPPGGRHRYEWTVTALGPNGAVLGQGSVLAPFPP
jgi:phosphatidylethanolamine-binding protein (PEBP) family uncharacterized protein